jgi:hypothetical protein
MKKINPSTIGLLEALGVVIYCSLIATMLNSFEKTFIAPPGILGLILMLVLLVFSAAITGSIVFGYPAYLALHKKFKEALSILAFTAIYFLGMILIILILIAVFSDILK